MSREAPATQADVEDSRVCVDVGPDLRAATAMIIRTAVADAMQDGRTIELHLQSVSSYDAAGLGLLVGLKHRIESVDGHLVCVNPSTPLYSGIRRLGLHRILDIRFGVDLGEDPRVMRLKLGDAAVVEVASEANGPERLHGPFH